MASDLTHLNALQQRLYDEQRYLTAETSNAGRELRAVWIAQIEREIAAEYKFLGIEPQAEVDLSDDELLAALCA